ncbi:dihydrofolate reductase [Caldimonas manganoxidans]|uniref:dihydrofolate reductase n=1 Tax=Caldimonas manganoxidans TaxID=196015 RepID=UPI00036962B3|nr:dihydrofolate reductase [Caldimonas manganoxidans]
MSQALPSDRPQIALIAAVARNGVIGRNNQLAWHLPEDLQHFKRVTMGCPVLMGRKTYESIGRPLPGRRNVVITRNIHWEAPGIEEAPSFEAALELLKHATKIYVIGGAQVYAEALPWADELVLTEIDHDFEGDTYFPVWDRAAFTEVARETHTSPEGWRYHFVTYQRRPPPVPDEP